MADIFVLDETRIADLKVVSARRFVHGTTERLPQEQVAYTARYGARSDIPDDLLQQRHFHVIGAYNTGRNMPRPATLEEKEAVIRNYNKESINLGENEMISALYISKQNTL